MHVWEEVLEKGVVLPTDGQCGLKRVTVTLTALTDNPHCMQALVPAAGRGSRLAPLTDDRPKGLVEIAGRPLLTYVFDTAIDAGAASIVAVIGYEGDQIRDKFGEMYRGTPLTYVTQGDRLGLGHAVLQARSVIDTVYCSESSVDRPETSIGPVDDYNRHYDGPILLLNGDNVFANGVGPAIDRFAAEDVDAVLGVEQVPESVARTTGVIEILDGRVVDIVEKPEDPPSRVVTTGCYVLPPEIVHACALLRPTAEGEYRLSEAVGLLAHAGYTIETVSLGPRVNVNRPADVDRAESMLDDA